MQSGGKVVNTIVLNPYIEGDKFKSLNIHYSTSYPVASNISIHLVTTGMASATNINISQNSQNGYLIEVDMDPETAEIQVISIAPQEDDTYIYEVVVEY